MKNPKGIPPPLSDAQIADAEERYMILNPDGAEALLGTFTDEYTMNLESASRATLERQLNTAAAWHTMRHRDELAEKFKNTAAKLAAFRLGEN
jgi:hypothetical protein